VTNFHYILDEHGEPKAEPDMLAWARWFQASFMARVVKQDLLSDGSVVSTVFLGLDHQFGSGPPILWETYHFSKLPDGNVLHGDRCGGSREQAEAMHARMVANIQAAAKVKL
jgi:hypothetical protein